MEKQPADLARPVMVGAQVEQAHRKGALERAAGLRQDRDLVAVERPFGADAAEHRRRAADPAGRGLFEDQQVQLVDRVRAVGGERRVRPGQPPRERVAVGRQVGEAAAGQAGEVEQHVEVARARRADEPGHAATPAGEAVLRDAQQHQRRQPRRVRPGCRPAGTRRPNGSRRRARPSCRPRRGRSRRGCCRRRRRRCRARRSPSPSAAPQSRTRSNAARWLASSGLGGRAKPPSRSTSTSCARATAGDRGGDRRPRPRPGPRAVAGRTLKRSTARSGTMLFGPPPSIRPALTDSCGADQRGQPQRQVARRRRWRCAPAPARARRAPPGRGRRR